MPSYLETLATQALQQVAVTIGTPSAAVPPQVWNETEWATVRVEVANSAGLFLRNAVVVLAPSGVPAVVIAYPPFPGGNRWFVGEVGPGVIKWHDFLVRPGEGGTLTLTATLTAEVVPYVTRGTVSRTETISHL